MAKQTSNFGFLQPEQNDFYDINVYNNNLERLDSILHVNGLENISPDEPNAPIGYRKMTAIIDLSNSNPTTCVTYADDAVDMVAGDASWDEFFGHYPVLFKDGAEVGKLNRDNFDQFEDGTTADISSGDAGDAMICFPRRGLYIKTNGTKLTVSMTDNPNDSAYEYNAHMKGSVAKDKFYLGAYKGFVLQNKLRSLKGKTPSVNQPIGSFRTYAQANGEGYEQSAFYQLIFRQVMFILKYKSLDSQTKIGVGFTEASDLGIKSTGSTKTWGMDCELIKQSNLSYMSDGTHCMKLFGIEDFWGNVYEWIDGLRTTSSRSILTATVDFNDAGSGYMDNGNNGILEDVGNYMSSPIGTTKSGFVMKNASGSASTHFCDHASINGDVVAKFGGYFASGSQAGVFHLTLADAQSRTHNTIGARLMYL